MSPMIIRVEVWNEDKKELENLSAVTFANTFSEAVHNAENHYGDALSKIEVVAFEPCDVLEISNEEAEHLIIENY